MNPHLPRPPAADDALAALLTRAALDEAPPAAAFAAVLQLRPGRAAITAAGPAAAVRRLVAQWVGGDSGAASPFGPAFGVRGGGGAVQRLYRAEQCEIDVRIQAQGEAWSFAGQLFGIDAPRQVLLSGPGFEAGAEPGATQEFGFTGLPAGSYTLTIKAGELNIVIPAIDVGPAGGA